ncbi:PLP-dependent aminotransferase family protein [Naasia aerilata]|uniref:aminotransferase-like domain-containing protein n=1 Tax=Naasia aerilata TaxID=1162966 RepID=UPI002573B736|nr:PLP-dependent aminotransferase family protein [Naasia aerilata]
MAAIGSTRLVRLLGDWQTGRLALHEDLAAQLRRLIRSGVLSSGTRLPAERPLGQALNLSRNTVSRALDVLRGEGLLSSRQGDGTYVTFRPMPGSHRGDDRLGSFVGGRDLRRIDLRSAALPGLSMVTDEIARLDGSRMRALVASHGYEPVGLPELRIAVAEYYSNLGLPTEPENILVTSGAQQALRLFAASMVNRDATVVLEEPSFRGAIESLKALGVRIVGVPSGADGIDIDKLASTVARVSPALIVLQSTVHNPTGSVLDGFRRSRVAAIAARHGVPVIDDATLADTIIDGDRRPIPWVRGAT